jgi:hypothetical protein
MTVSSHLLLTYPPTMLLAGEPGVPLADGSQINHVRYDIPE